VNTYKVTAFYGAEVYCDYVEAHDEIEAVADAVIPPTFEGELLDEIQVEVY
jgi:hypothetical protein